MLDTGGGLGNLYPYRDPTFEVFMQINSVNSRLIDAYTICDYVPLVRGMTNIIHIIAKIFIKYISPAKSGYLKYFYATHIKDKSASPCVTLIVPVLNIALVIYYYSNRKYDNPDWMLDAIKKDSSQIQFASRRLKADQGFMLSVVKYDGCLIKHVDPCLSRDPELIGAALEQNMRAFICLSKKEQPSLIACLLEKSIDFLGSLQNAGVDFNVQDQLGHTALVLAAANGHESIVAALIRAGADLDLQDQSGFTALMYAAANGHESIVVALIEAKADLNILADKKYYAFLYVSKSRPKKWKNIKKILAQKMKETEQGRELIQLKKRVNFIALLAHSWEIGGSVNVMINKKNVAFELEGFRYPKILSKIVKHTRLFLELYFRSSVEDVNERIFGSLIETYTCSGTHSLKSLDAPALLNRWRGGKPVLIPTGYLDHAITTLVWGEYLALCNRGGDDPTIKIHLFDREVNQLETDDIESLIKAQQLNKNNWTQRIAGLLKKLKSRRVYSLEKALLRYLPAQRVGNCAYASSEGMAFIFLALSHLKPGEKKYPEGIVRDVIHPLFSEWRDFQRLSFLRGYLNHLESRLEDVKYSERVFVNTLLVEGLRRESSFLNEDVWAPHQHKGWKIEKKRIQAILKRV